MNRRLLLAAPLIAASVLAGCGETGDGASNSGAKAAPPTHPVLERTVAQDSPVVARVEDRTELAALDGHLVWSERRGGRWVLLHLDGRRVERLPIAPSRRPFRIDLGRGETGSPVLAYVRCDRPTACVPRRYDLIADVDQRMVEVEAAGASVERVAIWGGDAAFVRRRGAAAAVEVALRNAAGETTPIPTAGGGPAAPLFCEKQPEARSYCRARVQSLDLGPDVVAHVWSARYAIDYSAPGNLHVLRRADRRDRIQVEGYISGACGSVVPIDAQVRGATVQYIRDLYNCNATSTFFHRFDARARRETRVEAASLRGRNGLAIAMARDGATTYWLQRRYSTYGSEACGAGGCTLRRSRDLRFRGLRKGDPRPSDGAENGTA